MYNHFMYKQIGSNFSVSNQLYLVTILLLLYLVTSLPLHLLGVFLLACLCLHLLYFDGVWLTATQVQLMVTHAQSKDTTVDTETGSKEYKVLKVKKTRELEYLHIVQ